MCTSKHRVWSPKHHMLGGSPPKPPLERMKFAMHELLFFITGLLLGGLISVVGLCLAQANVREDDDK